MSQIFINEFNFYRLFIKLYQALNHDVSIIKIKLLFIELSGVNNMIDLAASVTASTISTVILYPAERVKIEMQLQKSDNSVI